MQWPSAEVLGSAVVIGLVAMVGAYLRHIPVLLAKYIARSVVSTVVIDSRSNLFELVMRWFDALPYSKTCRLVAAKFASAGPQVAASGHPREELLCTPAPGLHLLTHRRRVVVLYRELSVSQQVVETVRVSCIFGGRRFVQGFLDDVIEHDLARTHAVTKVYALDKWGDGWKHVSSQPSRPMSSVFLPPGMKESTRSDIARFYDSQELYAKNGIAWTRGFLFVGQPGTGKTSLIRSLAHEFRLNLCLLSLVDVRLSDATLSDVLMKLPPRAALVIEDVDSFFQQRKKEDAAMRVSFSGLLNALDGAAIADGRLLFLTTNNHHALDSALVRPGRIDRVVEFGLSGEPEIRSMFDAFYAGQAVEVPLTLHHRIAPATVQENLLRHPSDPRAALRALESLVS